MKSSLIYLHQWPNGGASLYPPNPNISTCTEKFSIAQKNNLKKSSTSFIAPGSFSTSNQSLVPNQLCRTLEKHLIRCISSQDAKKWYEKPPNSGLSVFFRVFLMTSFSQTVLRRMKSKRLTSVAPLVSGVSLTTSDRRVMSVLNLG